MTTMLDDGMLKTAIFVSSLDAAAAERLLEEFPGEVAQSIRQAVDELGSIDPRQRRRVADDFMRAGALEPPQHGNPPGPAERFQAAAAPVDEVLLGESGGTLPFRFLQDAEADKLVKALAGERPQTVALVLAHLPSQQAGAVLVRLEAALQVEVIRRLVDLEEADPAVLHEVERALATRLSQQVHIQRRRVAGLHAVAGILKASARPVGAQILKNLAAYDRGLAEKLGPEPMSFEDLLDAGESAWGAIVDRIDRDVLMLALLGAPQLMVERVVAQLSTAEAEALSAQLDNPGPIRLRDVEQARRQVADVARQLVLEGRLPAPRPRRRVLSAAA